MGDDVCKIRIFHSLIKCVSPFSEFMRIPCVDAGLISPLVQLLNSQDQEVLLQTGRALGNICYDSRKCWDRGNTSVFFLNNYDFQISFNLLLGLTFLDGPVIFGSAYIAELIESWVIVF